MPSSSPSNGVIDVDALYLPDASAAAEPVRCAVVEESVFTIDVEDVGHYSLMWTPTANSRSASGYTPDAGVLSDDGNEKPEGLALALGFILSEGLIHRRDDILSIATCEDDPSTVKVRLKQPQTADARRRDMLISSSCGICGPGDILEGNALKLKQVGSGLRLSRDQIGLLMQRMSAQQTIFARTGGSHAAAIFDADGELLAVSEDLGRHNALDKAIGSVLLTRASLNNCGAVLSSRLSLEMVLKAVRADLQIVLAASAPTSLAIDLAERFGLTLCGFVRDDRATVYTHNQRIHSGAN